MSKWIYVAGPYTEGDTCAHVRRAVSVGMELRDLGFVPIIPHLFHFAHYLDPRPYDYWMDWDLAMLARCDVLLRLDGTSSGVAREVAHCWGAGVPVFCSVSDVVRWAEDDRP